MRAQLRACTSIRMAMVFKPRRHSQQSKGLKAAPSAFCTQHTAFLIFHTPNLLASSQRDSRLVLLAFCTQHSAVLICNTPNLLLSSQRGSRLLLLLPAHNMQQPWITVYQTFSQQSKELKAAPSAFCILNRHSHTFEFPSL